MKIYHTWWQTVEQGYALNINSGKIVTQMPNKYNKYEKPPAYRINSKYDEKLIQYKMTQYYNWSTNKSKNTDNKKIILVLRINRVNQTARYYMNSHDLGIAYYLDKNKNYWPCITLTETDQEVKLLDIKKLNEDNYNLSENDKHLLSISCHKLRFELHLKNLFVKNI